MKFLILDTYYPWFISDFYKRNAEGDIIQELFGACNFYSRNLAHLGHWAKEIIVNDEHRQKKWALNHGYSIGKPTDKLLPYLPYIRGLIRPSWVYEALELQIDHYQPDVLYFQDLSFLPVEFVSHLKSKVRFIVGQIACPLPPDKYFMPFDLIVSSLPNIVAHINKLGIPASYLALAFEPSILKHLKKLPLQYDAVHIGGYGPIHQERNVILEAVARQVPIDFWGYGIKFLSPDSPILKSFHNQAWGKTMYEILSNSKITMTKHITSVADGYANNMTLFEATGCGTLLITDFKKNLPDLFVPNKEVVTYKTSDELATKIKFYLSHDSSRKKVAAAGQRRTLSDHNYLKRMSQLLEILNKNLLK